MKSDIIVVIDQSQSMSDLRESTISNFNEFLRTQQANKENEGNMSIVMFNHHVNWLVKNVPIQNIEPLTLETYYPNGNTALLRAVTLAIKETRKEHRCCGSPDKTVLVVITDGEENASNWTNTNGKPYTKERLQKKIRKVEEKYGWDVFFLGANIDAFAEGAQLGVRAGATLQYEATVKGMQTAYEAMSYAVEDSVRNIGGHTEFGN